MRKILLLFSLFMVFLAVFLLQPMEDAGRKGTTASVPSAPAKASVLDRAKKSGVIRCGYWIYEPFISKDLKTGAMSGLTVDYIEQTAARLGKRVEWVLEVSFDQIAPAINYDRIDIFCVPCSPSEEFRKAFDFMGSFGSLPYYIYVAHNNEMDRDALSKARFSAIDGFLAGPKTTEHFPDAQLQSLPQMTPVADLYNQLKYNKTDAIVNEAISAASYAKQNPDVIKPFSQTPLFAVSLSYPVKKGDIRWGAFVQKMTDTSLPENRQIFLNLLEKYQLTTEDLAPESVKE